MILSILICTLPERAAMFEILHTLLKKQTEGKPVEIICNGDESTTGAKRNTLLQQAQGEFIAFIDDDDMVSDQYVALILDCIEHNPDIDCIGIQGVITFNGMNKKVWKHSLEYKSWYEENNIYYRCPNHLNPVRRTLALKAGFPDITFAEDRAYSMALLPYLEKEAVICESLYHYRFIYKKKVAQKP